MVENHKYDNFKKLLEYFVAHMEYVANGDKQHPGYNLYISPLEETGKFRRTGTGYNGHQIQQQVSKWSRFSVGEIAMNCSPQYGNYRTRMCYLNWIPTGLNVNAKWENEHISALSLQNYIDENTWTTITQPVSLNQLGLYDGQAANDILKSFCDSFIGMRMEWNRTMKYKPYIDILNANFNLVLTGAPGTGKTFLAREIAYAITGDTPEHHPHVAFVQFHPSYDYTDFVEGLRPVDGGDETIGFQRQDGIFKQFCKSALETEEITDNFEEVYSQFKSECDEEEGLEFQTAKHHKKFTVEFNSKLSCVATPQTGHGTKLHIKKEWFRDYLRSGTIPVLKPYLTVVAKYMQEKYQYKKSVNKICGSDLSNRECKHPFVFIIDEINRGDIAKIFGELFFAIDPGYRGEAGRIKTQYSNLIDDDDIFKKGFYVPENVYIIGTMNDIDRNVESMDFAIRRRFTWKEIEPDNNLSMWDNVKHGIPEYKEQASITMNAINLAIKDEKSGLGAQYQLGAAYFMKLRNYDGDFNKLWELHIAPLLHEYLRGMPEADKHFIELKAVWDKSLTVQQTPNAEDVEPPAQEQDNPTA